MNIFLPHHLLHGYDPSRARVTRTDARKDHGSACSSWTKKGIPDA
jgi:hypothetical protein